MIISTFGKTKYNRLEQRDIKMEQIINNMKTLNKLNDNSKYYTLIKKHNRMVPNECGNIKTSTISSKKKLKICK